MEKVVGLKIIYVGMDRKVSDIGKDCKNVCCRNGKTSVPSNNDLKMFDVEWFEKCVDKMFVK